MKINLSEYQDIVVLTGAGISTITGFHTSNRDPDSIGADYNIQDYGHIDRLNDYPEHIWQLIGPLRDELKTTQPNAAHQVLAKLEKQLLPQQNFTLITQNIDGLHQQAGSRNVVEYHGTIHITKCSNPDCSFPPYHDQDAHQGNAPLCPKCQHPLRPDIVLIDEQIPLDNELKSKQALRSCDLFISIGASSALHPASSLARSAEYLGARTIYINLDDSI